MNLSNIQQELITGSLLGDGSIRITVGKNYNGSFSKKQSLCDKDGVDKINFISFHNEILNDFNCKFNKKCGISFGKEVNFYILRTCSSPIFTELEKKWYMRDSQGNHILNKHGRIKIIPNDIVLSPLSLCIWYMDDGTNYSKDLQITLYTNCFAVDECYFLLEKLKFTFGINGIIHFHKNENGIKQPKISIGQKDSYFKFIEIVKSQVKWDCFKYKVDTSGYTKTDNVGENNWCSVLTEKDVREIFHLKNETNITNRELAYKFGVKLSTITFILTGRNWSHLGLKCNKIKLNRCKPRLSIDKKMEICNLRKSGTTVKDIGKIYNLHIGTVYNIINNDKYLNASS